MNENKSLSGIVRRGCVEVEGIVIIVVGYRSLYFRVLDDNGNGVLRNEGKKRIDCREIGDLYVVRAPSVCHVTVSTRLYPAT